MLLHPNSSFSSLWGTFFKSSSLIFRGLLKHFLTHCGRIVTLPEDMSFSEVPLQKDEPHKAGTPTEPISCFSVLSSSCFPSAGQGLAVPFGYPSTLLVALLHQQMI